MSARERAIDALEFFKAGQNVSAESVLNMVIEAVWEEIIPEGHVLAPWINVSPPPQKIQGYTAEQWQEIIDGGYLCEGKDSHDRAEWHPIILAELVDVFVCKQGNRWSECRPAQLKGVMRPIFVEPGDGGRGIGRRGVFFDEHNQPVESMGKDVDSDIWAADMMAVGATKYIEL